MRNPLTPRHDEHAWDRALFSGLLIIGLALVVGVPGDAVRPWFALTAFLIALTFVIIYSRYDWRATYAGRAAMLSMSVTTLYTLNATAILWWPRYDYGHPYWEETTELVYLAVAIAALYKLRALTRRTDPRAVNDPTTDKV